jgi:hypothetical protein
MATKLTILTHKMAVQLCLVVERSTICSSPSRRPVRKLLDAPARACIYNVYIYLYIYVYEFLFATFIS